MKTIKVKELMVPLGEYATVSEEATLYDAIKALEEAQQNVAPGREKHRAILVYDRSGVIVGKLGYLDVVRGIEPKYKGIDKLTETSRFGFSPEYLRSMLESQGLWRKPLEDICKKAAHIKVRDMMSTPSEGEHVEEDATLDQAIHQLIMGNHQSLLVTGGGGIVGILRLSDLFGYISDRIKECRI